MTPQTKTTTTYPTLLISSLIECPLNKRSTMDKQLFADLIASIKANGVIQAITTRPAGKSYEVVCGSRRWKAAKAAGLTEIPAVVRELSDEVAREIILIENIQREDVHPMDEAEGLFELSKLYPDPKVLSPRVGKEARYIAQILHLNNLIEAAKKKFREGNFSLEHALEIARLPTKEAQSETLKVQLDEDFDLFDLRRHIRDEYHLVLAEATFDTEDLALVPKAGACSACPKRTGFNALLFADIQEKDTCTDAKCFRGKLAAHIEREQKQWGHPEQPLVQLSGEPSYRQIPKDVLPSNQFRIVTGAEAKAKDVKHGIIVVGQGAGKLVAFTEPKSNAPEHRSAEQNKLGFTTKVQELETKRTNEEDIAAIPVLISAIVKNKPLAMTAEDFQFLAFEAIRRAGHDVVARACKGMSITPTKSKYNQPDYSSALEDNAIAGINTAADLSLWLLEFALYAHVGNRREPNDYASNGPLKEGNPIHILAKRRKLSFEDAWKPVHETFEEKKERCAKRWGFGDKAEKTAKPVKATANPKAKAKPVKKSTKKGKK